MVILKIYFIYIYIYITFEEPTLSWFLIAIARELIDSRVCIYMAMATVP